MKKVVHILLFIMLISCEEENISIANTCGVNNPIQDLSWLKDKIEEEESFTPSYFTLSQGIYNGETIFILDACCPECNVAPQAFDCTGNKIEFSSIEFDDVRSTELIAKGKDVICTFD